MTILCTVERPNALSGTSCAIHLQLYLDILVADLH